MSEIDYSDSFNVGVDLITHQERSGKGVWFNKKLEFKSLRLIHLP